MRKAARRANLELKKKGEQKAAAAKKMKEAEERLRRRGALMTKNQPKISIWLKKEGASSKRKGREWDKEEDKGKGTRRRRRTMKGWKVTEGSDLSNARKTIEERSD